MAFISALIPLLALAPALGAGVHRRVGPQVRDLVRLPRIGDPGADVLRVLLAHRHDVLEVLRPLAHPPRGGAVVAVLVDVALGLGRLERENGLEDPDVLTDEVLSDEGDVLLPPPLVLRELAPEPLALVEVGVAPQVHDLVERADLGQPVAFQLPVVVAADRAADLARVLRHGRAGAGPQGVGAKLVDHVLSPG